MWTKDPPLMPGTWRTWHLARYGEVTGPMLEQVHLVADLVARFQPLRDNSLQAHLAGVLEDRQTAIVLKVLIRPYAAACLTQDAGQRCPRISIDLPALGPYHPAPAARKHRGMP